MKSNNFPADFIVVGSGLGGLCAAAYLSRANHRVIVLEKNSEIGGRCGIRTINGHRYVTGANTFGSRMAKTLKDLGINLQWIPAPFRLHGEKGNLYFPLSLSSIKEIKTFGMSLIPFLKMLTRLSISMLRPSLSKMTYRNFIDKIVKETEIREILYLEAMFVGAHPDWLPASAFKLFLGTYYGYHKPIYPLQGAHTIPNALVEYIKAHGGDVLTEQNVTGIGIEKGIAHGVQVGNQWIAAKQAVISNAEIDQTLAMLKSDNGFSSLQNITEGSKSAFPLALLLLVLDAAKAPAIMAKPIPSSETSVTILTRPVCELIEDLERGNINDSSICNLILSDLKAQLMNGTDLSHLPVHVPIPWPKSSPSNINYNALKNTIITEIDRRYPGFAESVLSYQLLTPEEYKRRFGFSSNPAPILETLTFTKHSWELPIKNLYNVGTTVLPSGSHAGCAMESGVRCAADILSII